MNPNPNEICRRDHNGPGVRLEARADGKPTVVGYAAVFHRAGDPGTEYELYDDLVEAVAPGCFDRALREKDDCRALVNHDPGQLVGRASAGTLRLSVDATGLRYEIDPPDTQAGRDMVESVRRGDMTGSSFAFQVRSLTYSKRDDGRYQRTLNDVALFDVGPVTYPAYGGASAGVRSADGAEGRAAFEAWRRSQAADGCALDWAAHRARAVAVELAVESARAGL